MRTEVAILRGEFVDLALAGWLKEGKEKYGRDMGNQRARARSYTLYG